MRRIGLAVVVLVSLALTSVTGNAQQPAKLWRIGILAQPPGLATFFDTFRAGMRELGYIENRNIVIDTREGEYRELPGLANDLLRNHPDLLVTLFSAATVAAKQATSTTPILFVDVADPVAIEVVASLARPGGNVTGLTNNNIEVAAKRLQLLRDVNPKISRVAVIACCTSGTVGDRVIRSLRDQIEHAGQSIGVRIESDMPPSSDVDAAISRVTRSRADALLVTPNPSMVARRVQIAEHAIREKLPTIFDAEAHVTAGGLMSYSADRPTMYRRAAAFADKILRGTQAGTIAIEDPTKYRLAINMKTAKALGLTIPPSLLLRADQVID